MGTSNSPQGTVHLFTKKRCLFQMRRWFPRQLASMARPLPLRGSWGFSDTCGYWARPTQGFLTRWARMRLVAPATPHHPASSPQGTATHRPREPPDLPTGDTEVQGCQEGPTPLTPGTKVLTARALTPTTMAGVFRVPWDPHPETVRLPPPQLGGERHSPQSPPALGAPGQQPLGFETSAGCRA